MKVLVAVASKHGATAGMATAIGDQLVARGCDVEVTEDPEEVRDLDGYDAVILGSAVYAGRWMASAREFASRLREELERRPVWLFSSGPVGDPPKPEEDPADAPELVALTGARGHRTFAGALDRSQLNLGERAIVAALRVPNRDDRDWAAITAWADAIASELGHP